MERADAIRKIRAMRNPAGRTPEEALAFRAKADAMMQSNGIAEWEIAEVADFYEIRRPAYSQEQMDAKAKAQEAIWAAQRASAAARTRRFYEQAEQMRRERAQAKRRTTTRSGKAAPRRADFEGEVPHGRTHPRHWREFMATHGIRTNGDLARHCGVSSSLVSEWMGKGRMKFASTWEFDFYTSKALKSMGKEA